MTFPALRDEVWLSASDSVCWDGIPLCSETSEYASAIVRDVGESVAVSADLFGEHVEVLDPAVRGVAHGVVGEDLFLPAFDGASQTGHFRDCDLCDVLIEHDQTPLCVRNGSRCVN